MEMYRGKKKTVSQVIQTHRESRSKTYHVQYVSLVWWTRPPGHGLKKVYEEILTRHFYNKKSEMKKYDYVSSNAREQQW